MTCNVQFEGVFCPSITITNADGTIDYDNWGKHLDHLIDAGIDGVLLFGSIGEFYAIDVKTKAEAVRFAVSKVAGRMKVIAAVRKVNPSFSVLSGFDEYYTVNRISGGNGVLCGLTNVEPETFVSLHHAWQSGDYATAIKSAERISYLMRLYDTADLFISAIKGVVKAKGLPIDTSIHEPAVQLTDEQYRNIQSILK